MKLFLVVTVISSVITLLGVVLGWGLQLGESPLFFTLNGPWAVAQWVFPCGVPVLVFLLTSNVAWSAVGLIAVTIPTVVLLVRALAWRPLDQIRLMVGLGLAGPILTFAGLASLMTVFFHSWVGSFLVGLGH